MLNRSGYQAYQKNKYETASPHKLILLLYDAALSNVSRAAQALDRGMKVEANQFIMKSQEIVSELMACLNMEQGGEVAKNLRELYFYMINQLVEANIRKKKEPLVEVEGILQNLRGAWDQIGKDVGLSAT